MSADNFLAIIKGKDGKFRGYDLSASMAEENSYDYNKLEKYFPAIVADNIEEAVHKAQAYCQNEIVEYGYSFMNLDNTKPKQG